MERFLDQWGKFYNNCRSFKFFINSGAVLKLIGDLFNFISISSFNVRQWPDAKYLTDI